MRSRACLRGDHSGFRQIRMNLFRGKVDHILGNLVNLVPMPFKRLYVWIQKPPHPRGCRQDDGA